MNATSDLLEQATAEGELTLSVSAFKARCLAVFKALESGRLRRVVVTRRGKPVAAIEPPAAGAERPRLWGAHKGSVRVPPGVDLTEPTFDEPFDAELGILHR